jgi:hypothetical protein
MNMNKILRRILWSGLGALGLAAAGGFTYVNLTYRRDFSSIPLPPIKASQDPAVIAQGAYVANALAHCSACHGNGESTNKYELPPNPKDLRGGYVLRAGPFGTFYPVNLTSDSETGIGKLTDPELARAIPKRAHWRATTSRASSTACARWVRSPKVRRCRGKTSSR